MKTYKSADTESDPELTLDFPIAWKGGLPGIVTFAIEMAPVT